MKVDIVHITTQWLSTLGGPTTYVRRVSEVQTEEGLKVRVFAPDPTSDLYLSVTPWKRSIMSLLGLLKYNPRIVHVHGSIYFIVPALLFKLIRMVIGKGVTIVFTFHTQPVFKSYLSDATHQLSYCGFRGTISNFLMRCVDHVTVVSGSIAKNLNAYTKLSLNRYEVIGSGVDLDSSLFEGKKSEHAGDAYAQQLKICSIGVFSWDWKVAGHLLLIEAIHGLKKELNCDIRAYIVGDGGGRRLIEQAIKAHDLEESVVLTGFLDDPGAILSSCDVYVHTGLNEGCPLSILEAIAGGLPVFAADAGGNSELITHNRTGYLFDPTSDALIHSLKNFLSDELSPDVATHAISYVRANHTWNVIANKYSTLYFGK